tara:strand:- start:7003 stop:7773 length:771 start_codon:yes stop_codon:yes gene_type:complete
MNTKRNVDVIQLRKQLIYEKYNDIRWASILDTLEEIVKLNPDISCKELWEKLMMKDIGKPVTRQEVTDIILETFTEYIPNADLVIDLGSGWGRYGVTLANAGLSQPIYLMEYAESGRFVADYFSKKYFNGRLKSYPFDYYEPNFTMIPEKTDVFVYSSYSVEQIPNLDKIVFTKLLERFNEVVGFHIEPVGWQLPEPLSDNEKFHKRRCIRKGYNKNFYKIIKDLESEKKIEIIRIIRQLEFDRTDGTVIIWKKIN